MSNFMVVIKHDPGVDVMYLVENVPDHRAARQYVRNIKGFDPGVPVEVTECPVHKNLPVKFSNLGRCSD